MTKSLAGSAGAVAEVERRLGRATLRPRATSIDAGATDAQGASSRRVKSWMVVEPSAGMVTPDASAAT